jgi:hypothetical protein
MNSVSDNTAGAGERMGMEKDGVEGEGLAGRGWTKDVCMYTNREIERPPLTTPTTTSYLGLAACFLQLRASIGIVAMIISCWLLYLLLVLLPIYLPTHQCPWPTPTS